MICYDPHNGINRIRLEFKVVDQKIKSVNDLRINRIRLEFKEICYTNPSRVFNGLIESDWNLKCYDRYVIVLQNKGLIESDWNLKYVWTMILSDNY